MELTPVFHGIIFHGILELLPHLVEYPKISSGTHRDGTERTSSNMYIGSNGWRYIILWENVSEGIFCVRK